MLLARRLSPLGLIGDYLWSSASGARQRASFSSVEGYVVFVGYPRSGHSLVGSLLNAHPEVVIGHQLNALRYVAAHFSRNQLFSLILRADRRYGRRGRVSNKGRYSYSVPNQWQGRFSELRVLGDKRGRSTTEFLRDRPALFARLQHLVGVPVRLLHVVRNPFDNISTIAVRRRMTLESAVAFYFDLCVGVAAFRALNQDADWLDVRHEDLISDAPGSLRLMCTFLDVPADDGYIDDCASIVYKNPHQSRHDVPWTPELIERVEKQMQTYPFLDGYTFE